MTVTELLGEAEIKEYLHYLITERKVGDSYVSSAYSALKFSPLNWADGWKNVNNADIRRSTTTLAETVIVRNVKALLKRDG